MRCLGTSWQIDFTAEDAEDAENFAQPLRSPRTRRFKMVVTFPMSDETSSETFSTLALSVILLFREKSFEFPAGLNRVRC